MAWFNLFKSKDLKHKAFTLQQQLISLEEEVASEEKKKEDLQSQVQILNNQICEREKEIKDLDIQKERIKKDIDDKQIAYDNLLSLLQASTTKIRSLHSTSDGMLINFNYKYLVALDENDFNELSSFYELKRENESLSEQKKVYEKELHKIENSIKVQDEMNATLQQKVDMLQQQVSTEESRKNELTNQIDKLEKRVTTHKDELYNLKRDKEKEKKELKKLEDAYEKLTDKLNVSTHKVRGVPSSILCTLANLHKFQLSDKYLISIDDEDFQELSKYYSLKKENSLKEKELQAIDEKIKEAKNELILLHEESVKNRDLSYTNEMKVIKEEISIYTNELNEIKRDIDGYLKSHKDKMRFEMMHEIYQRFTSCEDSKLKEMRENIDEISLTTLHDITRNDKAIVMNGCITQGGWILWSLKSFCNEFIQLNKDKITKDMKSSDWESVKLNIGSMIKVVESLLRDHGYSISKYYFQSLYNVMEAKYISIQKQEIEREKAREEREAQREYEQAIKKALKDEEKAREALERKKREMAETQTQEKILKLQEQIQGLEKALVEAQEMRERAMSMAQQTKIGYVYVISNIGSFGKDVYKIGMTRRLDPMERVFELSNASVPFPFDVHTFIYSEDAPALEAELHRIFDNKKVNFINNRKEYFHVTLDEIKKALAERGVDAKFVDEPDAFQYRECMFRHNHQDMLYQ